MVQKHFLPSLHMPVGLDLREAARGPRPVPPPARGHFRLPAVSRYGLHTSLDKIYFPSASPA